MKIAVCIKQVIDTEAAIVVNVDGTLDVENQTQVIDPYGEFCIEKAVQLKEEHGGEVVVVSVGARSELTAVRHALAMGADRAIVIECDKWHDMPVRTKAAKLASVLEDGCFDLVMGGWKSADTGNAQVMGRIAETLRIPFANMVVSMQVEGGEVKTTCEIDDGLLEASYSLPVVVAAQQGLAEPRYPAVRDVLQARKKPVEYLSDDQVPTAVSVVEAGLVSRAPRPPRRGGRIIPGDTLQAVRETVRCLREEAKVL